ncbi:hypothetical protein H920_19504 [Fukomys damarensis]|uniref:Uncharacterized protein n=1 Tax=Fukomys damarensis TaxID=885580 RepID=A0A091CPK4_FUKDA|nr:hypothetical protein H920_19504 [Fukomys damarensis]
MTKTQRRHEIASVHLCSLMCKSNGWASWRQDWKGEVGILRVNVVVNTFPKKVLKALHNECDNVPPQNTDSTLRDIRVANRSEEELSDSFPSMASGELEIPPDSLETDEQAALLQIWQQHCGKSQWPMGNCRI